MRSPTRPRIKRPVASATAPHRFMSRTVGYGAAVAGSHLPVGSRVRAAAQALPRAGPKRVLEIGTYHGGTLYHWLKNASRGEGRERRLLPRRHRQPQAVPLLDAEGRRARGDQGRLREQTRHRGTSRICALRLDLHRRRPLLRGGGRDWHNYRPCARRAGSSSSTTSCRRRGAGRSSRLPGSGKRSNARV